jgi:hypothetical protein
MFVDHRSPVMAFPPLTFDRLRDAAGDARATMPADRTVARAGCSDSDSIPAHLSRAQLTRSGAQAARDHAESERIAAWFAEGPAYR